MRLLVLKIWTITELRRYRDFIFPFMVNLQGVREREAQAHGDFGPNWATLSNPLNPLTANHPANIYAAEGFPRLESPGQNMPDPARRHFDRNDIFIVIMKKCAPPD